MANEDKPYLAWIRKQRCAASVTDTHYEAWRETGRCRVTPCDPHHATGAGMSLRHHDHTAIPLCRLHHDCIHNFRGPFMYWTRERRREWHERVAAGMRAKWELEQGVFCEVTMGPDEVF